MQKVESKDQGKSIAPRLLPASARLADAKAPWKVPGKPIPITGEWSGAVLRYTVLKESRGCEFMRNKALEVLVSSIYRSVIHISFFL